MHLIIRTMAAAAVGATAMAGAAGNARASGDRVDFSLRYAEGARGSPTEIKDSCTIPVPRAYRELVGFYDPMAVKMQVERDGSAHIEFILSGKKGVSSIVADFSENAQLTKLSAKLTPDANGKKVAAFADVMGFAKEPAGTFDLRAAVDENYAAYLFRMGGRFAPYTCLAVRSGMFPG